MKRLNSINDALTYMRKKIPDIADADELHIFYGSYLDNFPKGHERLKRTAEVEPTSFVNLSRQSPAPVQLERFWTCSVNKVKLQSISRKFFVEISQISGITVVPSSCVTQTDSLRNFEMFTEIHIHSNFDDLRYHLYMDKSKTVEGSHEMPKRLLTIWCSFSKCTFLRLQNLFSPSTYEFNSILSVVVGINKICFL